MHKIINYKTPDDFVISSGNTMSVRQFTKIVFQKLGIELLFKFKGYKEIGYINKVKKELNHLSKNQILIKVSKKYFRPTDVNYLKGDFTKANKLLKWKPTISLNKLIDEMIDSELNHYE